MRMTGNWELEMIDGDMGDERRDIMGQKKRKQKKEQGQLLKYTEAFFGKHITKARKDNRRKQKTKDYGEGIVHCQFPVF